MLSWISQDSLQEQNQENDICYKRSHVRLSYTIGTGQFNMAVIMLGTQEFDGCLVHESECLSSLNLGG